MNRRHDIDALRALAFALVILYHLAMYYVAGWDWHVKSPHAAQWLQWPMRALNLWRMDLVFLISGLAFGFLQRGQPPGALLRQRSVRLLLPLAFAMAVIVPFQPYAQMLAKGLVEPGFGAFLLRYFSGGPWPRGAFDGSDFGVTWNHLWYLPYLWAYTALVTLALPLLRSAAGRRLRNAFVGLRGAALVLVPALPLLAYSLALWPRFPARHDLIHDGWLHAVYFTLFLYGNWIGLDAGFWREATRLRRRTLAASLGLLAAIVLARGSGLVQMPAGGLALRLLADLYLWSTILAILGWAHLKLNRPWPWLHWANESVYPWYILHQSVIIVLVVWLAPLALGPVLEPALLLAGTVLGCWGVTSAVRRVDWLRPLFGLKRTQAAASAASMSPLSDSGLSRGA
ncbi:acyltransferase family protein [Caenimonas terrae]|uniref:Acyltransferase family protein n=1 Tax=Caenimonas terrae TaxID=696074 RepID=A0ABW0N8B9_9BURK